MFDEIPYVSRILSMVSLTPRNNLHQLAKACKSINQLKEILTQVILTGTSNHSSTLSTLLSLSATSLPHPDLHFASLIFTHIEKPNSFHHNSLIRGFTNVGHPAHALQFYIQTNRREERSVLWDNFTYPFVIKACALLLAVELGHSIHGKVFKIRFSFDRYVGSSLVRMYAEFGEIENARVLFDESPERDTILWNSMVGGYLKCGEVEKAREIFDSVPDKNVGSFNAMIGGYAKLGCLEMVSNLFDEMPLKDVISWNTVIGAHARFGSVVEAQKLFDEAPMLNVGTWSSIISGFTQGFRFNGALDMFKRMMVEGVVPNQAILVSVLSCCAHLGALDQGVWIHGYVEKCRIEVDDILGASLIDMYSKCGLLEKLMNIFDKIDNKSVSSWTSMIYGFAIHGHAVQALELFSNMKKSGIRPNGITFVAVLCACSHAGLVDRGQTIFEEMIQVHSIRPAIEHYTCMVDLLSRANLLDEAEALIKAMPMEPDILTWGALFGGYRIHGGGKYNLLGDEDMEKKLSRLDANESGTHILLSNIYASTKQWDKSWMMRKMMEEMGIKKNIGCSVIEVNQVVHEFSAAGRLHPESEQIYDTLDQIYRETVSSLSPNYSHVDYH